MNKTSTYLVERTERCGLCANTKAAKNRIRLSRKLSHLRGNFARGHLRGNLARGHLRGNHEIVEEPETSATEQTKFVKQSANLNRQKRYSKPFM